VIVLEITDESGVTHYEKTASTAVQKAVQRQKTKHSRAANHGDEAAKEASDRINGAGEVLKIAKSRKDYDESIAAGDGGKAAVLQPQEIGAPFFGERAVRFRVIEQLMPVMAPEG
jgi:DnaJ-class molecular chaperone